MDLWAKIVPIPRFLQRILEIHHLKHFPQSYQTYMFKVALDLWACLAHRAMGRRRYVPGVCWGVRPWHLLGHPLVALRCWWGKPGQL